MSNQRKASDVLDRFGSDVEVSRYSVEVNGRKLDLHIAKVESSRNKALNQLHEDILSIVGEKSKPADPVDAEHRIYCEGKNDLRAELRTALNAYFGKDKS